MAHAKQQIRDAAVAKTGGLTTTGARVFNEWQYPHGEDKLPGLNWRSGVERLVQGKSTMGYRQLWELQLICEGRAKPPPGNDLDEVLDTIQAEVQTAIMGDDPPTLDSLVRTIELRETRKTGAGLERPAGAVFMVFVCEYWILAGDPTELIYFGGGG